MEVVHSSLLIKDTGPSSDTFQVPRTGSRQIGPSSPHPLPLIGFKHTVSLYYPGMGPEPWAYIAKENTVQCRLIPN
jgi:hypothetical protein